MNNLSEIKNPEYHNMSFEEADKVREDIKDGKLEIKIRQGWKELNFR